MASEAASVSSNNAPETMLNEHLSPIHPPSGFMISHSRAMREATAALENLIAIEVQMGEYRLRILNTKELDVASSMPSLVIGDHTYYNIAMVTAVPSHGRLRSAYWRVAQEDERSHTTQAAVLEEFLVDCKKSRREWEETEARLRDEIAVVETTLYEKGQIIVASKKENSRLKLAKRRLKKANQVLRRRYIRQTDYATGEL